MPDPLQLRWRISAQAVASAAADGTVILNLMSGTYFGLDPIGARLWDALKAGDTPASFCAAILATYDVEQAQLEEDMRELIGDLVTHSLIEEA